MREPGTYLRALLSAGLAIAIVSISPLRSFTNSAIGEHLNNQTPAKHLSAARVEFPIGTIRGEGRITINGSVIENGATVLSGSVIETGATSEAFIDLGSLGFIKLGANETIMLAPLADNLVGTAQGGQTRYVIRPVGLGANFSVAARATRQLQVQVTDENDNPQPDKGVIFTLGDSGQGPLGTLTSGAQTGTTVRATTNAMGIATVIFNAGATLGLTKFTATVEGTDTSWTGDLNVVDALVVPGGGGGGGPWISAGVRGLLALLGVAGAVATGIAVGDEESVSPPVSPNRP